MVLSSGIGLMIMWNQEYHLPKRDPKTSIVPKRGFGEPLHQCIWSTYDGGRGELDLAWGLHLVLGQNLVIGSQWWKKYPIVILE